MDAWFGQATTQTDMPTRYYPRQNCTHAHGTVVLHIARILEADHNWLRNMLRFRVIILGFLK